MKLLNELAVGGDTLYTGYSAVDYVTDIGHVRLNITGLEAPYAVIRIGQPAAENALILNRREFGQVLKEKVKIDQVDRLRQMAPNALDVGTRAPDGNGGNGNAARAMATAQDEKKEPDKKKNSLEEITPSTPEEENSLQTEAEAVFSLDPDLLKRVQEMFATSKFCENQNKGTLDETRVMKFKHPTLGFEIERPIFSKTFACINTGDLVLTESIQFVYFDFALIGAKAGGKMVINTFTTNVESNKELFVQKIAETSKLGVGLSFGFGGPTAPDPRVVQEGGKAFKDGKPLINPSTGSQVGLSLEHMKQHFELTLRAEARFKLIHQLKDTPVEIPLS